MIFNTKEAPNKGLISAISQLAGGDSQIEQGLIAGLGLSGLGNGTVAPEEGFYHFGSLGRLDPGVTNQLNELFLNSIYAGNKFKKDEALALDKARDALGGLNTTELGALREQGERGIDSAIQSAIRQARQGNIQLGRKGAVEGSFLPSLTREVGRAQGDLATNIILADAAQRRSALGDFTGLLGQLASTDLARLGNAQSFGLNLNNALFGRDVFNLGQLEKEKAGQLGLLFGGGQFASAQAGRQAAEDIAREQIEASKQIGFAQQAPQPVSIDLGGFLLPQLGQG